MNWLNRLQEKYLEFKRNQHGAIGSFVAGVVGMVIAIIVIIAVVPTIVTTVQDTNTTGWNFTGSAGAVSLFNLIPFVVIAGALLVAVSYGLSMRRGD
jgi:hypothetical protein